MSNQTKNRRAFTLLELLIVIVIIGVLAAILIRQITKAREAGWATQCRVNLHNLHQASLNYSVVLPSGPYATNWVKNADGTQPVCYGGAAKVAITNGMLWEYTKTLKSYICPKFRDIRVQPDAWRSYAMNTNMCGRSPLPTATRTIATEKSRTIWYAELQPWKKDPRGGGRPDICASSADGSDAEGNNGVLIAGATPPTGTLTTDTIGYIHSMSGVYYGHVVFCDGHVEAVPLLATNRTYDACNGRF